MDRKNRAELSRWGSLGKPEQGGGTQNLLEAFSEAPGLTNVHLHLDPAAFLSMPMGSTPDLKASPVQHTLSFQIIPKTETKAHQSDAVYCKAFAH